MLFNNLEQAEKLKTNQYITEVYWWVSQDLKSEKYSSERICEQNDFKADSAQQAQHTQSMWALRALPNTEIMKRSNPF